MATTVWDSWETRIFTWKRSGSRGFLTSEEGYGNFLTLMFAIIKTGGKQYKVKTGDELEIERLPLGKAKSVKLDHVLLFSDKEGAVEVGRPFVKGAYCEAEVVGEIKGPKSISFKYIRR